MDKQCNFCSWFLNVCQKQTSRILLTVARKGFFICDVSVCVLPRELQNSISIIVECSLKKLYFCNESVSLFCLMCICTDGLVAIHCSENLC